MTDYRCYFLDTRDKIRSIEQIRTASDSDALERCRRLFAERPYYPTVELWARGRCIHSETRKVALTH